MLTKSGIISILKRPSLSWIKNSIKPNRVQHIIRHIYYANLKHYIRPKFNVKVIKATHRRRYFSKTFVSQKIFASIGLRKVSKILAEIMILTFLHIILPMLE